ncbi:MAG: ATP-binding protein [Actinobacteria bacterium]|nr:ATP-binding protein [Actinomycetota bacterium]
MRGKPLSECAGKRYYFLVPPELYRPRLVDGQLAALLADFSAVMLVGPRASGKTTTALRLTRSHVRLDHEGEAVAFRADPDSALRTMEEPILLDEWQEVPGVLGAVKRAVDSDPSPGRFVIAGSVRADTGAHSWPLTGRAIRVTMLPLTEREISGDPTALTFLDRLLAKKLTAPKVTPDLADCIARALRGGFPHPALHLSTTAARVWLDSYLDQILTRDASPTDARRDPERLRRYVEAVAAHTAGIVEHKTLFDAAGVARDTGDAYSDLLTNLFVLDLVPAWSTNRLKRVTRSPKRYLVDAGLVASALQVDVTGVLRDGDLIGRILDTFVASQLRAELSAGAAKPRLFHLRQEQGRHEVDLIVEFAGGRIIAIEVKATAAPRSTDARHLGWLRDELGDRFLAGVVFHTGPGLFEMGDRLIAAPVSTLWA